MGSRLERIRRLVVGKDGRGGERESHRVLWVVAGIATNGLASVLHLHVVVVGRVAARIRPLLPAAGGDLRLRGLPAMDKVVSLSTKLNQLMQRLLHEVEEKKSRSQHQLRQPIHLKSLLGPRQAFSDLIDGSETWTDSNTGGRCFLTMQCFNEAMFFKS